MPRFFISPIPLQGQDVALRSGDETHHILHVLRLKTGNRVELIDGKGTWAQAVIVRISGLDVVLHVEDRKTIAPKDRGRIVLACAIPKKAKFETILEKCTELGVDEMVPMITQRTEVRPRSQGGKEERFQKVVLNAAKQSKRLFFPVVHPTMSFDDVLAQFVSPRVIVLIPWLEGERVPLKSAIAQSSGEKDFLVFIGPEGDFTPDEVSRALELGATAVTLGENTLKVDTAAIAIVAGMRLFL